MSFVDFEKVFWALISHGDTPDDIRNHPLLEGLDIPPTGRPGRGAVLATKTLLISGEHGFATTEHGHGALLRAYDKATGARAGEVFMPAPQTGALMTYMLDDRQFIVVPVGAQGYGAEFLAYAILEHAGTRPERVPGERDGVHQPSC